MKNPDIPQRFLSLRVAPYFPVILERELRVIMGSVRQCRIDFGLFGKTGLRSFKIFSANLIDF